MKVVVTGATGFVGSSLATHLLNCGHHVLQFSRGNLLKNDLRFVATDYENIPLLETQLVGVDVLVHLAGIAHQAKSKLTFEDYIRANVDTTISLATAAKRAGVKRIILVSSIGVNGDDTNGRGAFSEEDEPRPTNFYSRSKLMAEKSIQDVLKNSQTEFVILRPPIIYGAHCPGNFRSLLKLCLFMPILPFGSLAAKKSMMYIDNFLDAIAQCLSSPTVVNQVFIVSDSQALRLNAIISILLQRFHGVFAKNLAVNPSFLGALARVVGRRSQWSKFASTLEVDSTKFHKLTNWSPPVSPQEGIQLSAKGFRRNA